MRACVHASVCVRESSVRAAGALRDLDSMTSQERVIRGGGVV